MHSINSWQTVQTHLIALVQQDIPEEGLIVTLNSFEKLSPVYAPYELQCNIQNGYESSD